MKFKLMKSFVFALLILVTDVSKAMVLDSFGKLQETHHAARMSSIDCFKEVFEKEYRAKPEKLRNLVKHEIYSGHVTTVDELSKLAKLPASIIFESFVSEAQAEESEVDKTARLKKDAEAATKTVEILKQVRQLDALVIDKERAKFRDTIVGAGGAITKADHPTIFAPIRSLTNSINANLGVCREYLGSRGVEIDHSLAETMKAYTTATVSYSVEDYDKIVDVVKRLSEAVHGACNPLVDTFFAPSVVAYMWTFIDFYSRASEERPGSLASVETIYKERWGEEPELLCFTLKRFFSSSGEYIKYTSGYSPASAGLLARLDAGRSIFSIVIPVKFGTERGQVIEAYIASCYPATK